MNANSRCLYSHPMYRRACCLLFVLLWLGRAKAAQVVYLTSSNEASQTREQVETAARFYGLTFVPEILGAAQDEAAVWNAIASSSTVAVVMDAKAMAAIPRQRLVSATKRDQHFLPIMVAGINASTSATLLQLWSSGAVREGGRAAKDGAPFEQIGSFNNVTRQLAGSRLPLAPQLLDYLVLSPSPNLDTLAEAGLQDRSFPLFVRVVANSQELFFAAEVHPASVTLSPDPYRQQAIFGAIAAPMMFLRYAAGDRAWHSPGNYANFTIDDLWLREPYGHVNYEELLAHSQAHHFHTTIAFIPWNFDRSQPAMAALFRAHPDRLSVCVHGNDHIHQEFGPLADHPLAKQAGNINQSLTRMKKFTELTGVPFDPVMVFPHSVSPEKTFAELKRANFLATANSLNVPSDANVPSGAEFALRSATLDFANFPSLRRYSAETEIPRAQLAIDAFLGNPMLFYAHESYFASGIGAFDSLADSVNQLQPDLQWQSLGQLVQHLYLQRLEDDGTITVQASSPAVRLRNDQTREILFRVRKEEDFGLPVHVFVDGQSVPYERNTSGFSLQLPIQPGSSRLIEVRYGSLAAPSGVDLRSHSGMITAIRLLSDFRDNFISRSNIGRWFIRSYVTFGGRWRAAFVALLIFAAIFFISGRRWLPERRTRATKNLLLWVEKL